MKKIFLTSGLVVCMACPAFADVITKSENGNCVVGVLGVSEQGSTATLEAQWDAIISGAITLNGKRYAQSTDDSADEQNPMTNAQTATSTVYSQYDTGMFSDALAQSPIDTITKPTIAGYTFGGYYTGKAGTGDKVINADGTFTDGAKNVISTTGGTTEWFAQWTATRYGVFYQPGDHGTGGRGFDNDATFDSNYTIRGLGANPTGGGTDTGTSNVTANTGYHFKGWLGSSTGTIDGGAAYSPILYTATQTIEPYRIAGNLTLTAQWEADAHKIKYLGGKAGARDVTATAMADQNVAYDDANVELSENTYAIAGYTFAGWKGDFNKDGSAAGTAAAPTASYIDKDSIDVYKVDGDLTLTAQWTPINYTLTYSCGTATAGDGSTKNIGGTAPDGDTVAYDSEVELATDEGGCALTGYTFQGWSCTGNAVNDTVSGKYTWTQANNITCTAQWKANEIELTWDAKGATTFKGDGDPSCTYDGGINIPTQPEKTGYTFQGWKVKPATTTGDEG